MKKTEDHTAYISKQYEVCCTLVDQSVITWESQE